MPFMFVFSRPWQGVNQNVPKIFEWKSQEIDCMVDNPQTIWTLKNLHI